MCGFGCTSLMHRRAFDRVSFLGAGIFLLVLAMGSPASKATAEANVMKLGIDAADLGTGDPHKAASRNDRAVVDMIFNGLLRYKPGEAPSIEPDLALTIPHPRIVDGKQVWTFELRRDATCHAGPRTPSYQLTADDVVYSFQRAADPERSSWRGTPRGLFGNSGSITDHSKSVSS